MKEKQTQLLNVLFSPHSFLFLITSDREWLKGGIISYFKNAERDTEMSIFDTKQVTVSLVEEILALARSQTIKKRIIILSFYTFLPEAQNKMLKTLEEPHPHIRFVFITESKQGLLPAVLSRAEVTHLSSEEEEGSEKLFDTKLFLATNKSLRMEIPFVKKILAKKDSDDKKDKEYLAQFLTELMAALPKTNEGMKGRADIVLFLKYTKDVSVSSKMMLDYLALSLPYVIE